jgi:hypothetical protein
VRILDLAQNLDAVPFPVAPHGADEVAEAINGKNGRLVESGDKEATRHVRLMVLDVVELGAKSIGRNLQRACQFVTQIANLGGIGKPSGNQA